MSIINNLISRADPANPAGSDQSADHSMNEAFAGGRNVYSGVDSSNLAGVLDDIQGTPSNTSDFSNGFIGDSFYDTGGVFGRPFGSSGVLEIEKSYILQQRTISLYPEVAIGIEEIMRDLFSKDLPLNLNANTESSDFDTIRDLFDKFREKPFNVISSTKTPDPLVTFNFLKQTYIDGRITLLSLLVDTTDTTDLTNYYNNTLTGKINTEGLQESMVFWKSPSSTTFNTNDTLSEEKLISIIEYNNRLNLDLNESVLREDNPKTSKKSKKSKDQVDKKDKNVNRIFVPIDPVKIHEDQGKTYYVAGRANKIEISEDSIIQSDFGLFDVTGARHGFLLYAFKYANQLQNLQDMLIPMRFRRSVARRVFNVDISMLPHNRAISYMKNLQKEFKYKKHYDATSGRIVSKTNDPTGIVEDYWFANRSGGKGTTVDTIDEAGNFQDSLDDINYFNKKLYQSMFIPLRRIFESDASYDYTANSIEVDELRFQSFLTRVRFVYNNVLTDMFNTILKDHGIETEGVEVTLNYDNWYEQAKTKEDFENAIDLYESAKPLIGKLFSAETVIDKVFGLTPGDVAEEFEKIAAEIQEDNPLYAIYVANSSEEEEDY